MIISVFWSFFWFFFGIELVMCYMSQRYFANNLFKIDYQVLDSKIFLNFIWFKEEMAKVESNVIFMNHL